MSGKEEYNFSDHIHNALEKVKEFVFEREQLNSKLKNYILYLQNIDSKIFNALVNAREFYVEKRYKYNAQLEELKRNRVEYEQQWNRLRTKLKALPKPVIDSNISVSIEYTKRALENIVNNIDILNEKLEDQILAIEEENEIIEKLRDLEINKQKNINVLADLEQKQIKTFQNSEYNITKKKIQNLESKLYEIYENLYLFSFERLMTHKKMLGLYKNAREFDNIKQEIVEELKESRSNADEYHQLFLKLMDQNKKVLLANLSSRSKRKVQPKTMTPPKVILTPKEKAIIKKKKKFKRHEQRKLEIAIEKQRSGRRLDFYELQLIMKHSKKK